MADQVCLVTGGGRGIGRAIALRLAQDGLHVVVADRDIDTAEETVALATTAGGSSDAVTLDVSCRSDVFTCISAIVDRHGRLDGVVNNAMWIRYLPITDFDEETVDGMLGVGVKSALWTIQAAAPIMRAQGSGSIVNLSSPAAVRSVPGGAVYSMVKGAVGSLTTQAAGELGPSGIRVNAVLPGAVPTPGATSVVDEEGYHLRLSRTPLGRLGEPEDIANSVAFLLSPRSGFVNGHTLVTDGGFLIT